MRRHVKSDSEDSEAPEEVDKHRQHPAAAGSGDFGQPDASGGDNGSDADSGTDTESESDHQEQALEQQLADIPFEVLEKLHQDGQGPTPAAARAAAIAAKQKLFHRENKNRPQEVSSKRPVSRFREVIQVPKQPSKDPRFDATIGGKQFSKDAFAKRYSFLYDDVIPQERARLKEQLKKEKREGKRRDIQAQLTRLQQQLSDEKSRRKSEQLDKSWKSQEKAAVAAGKKPFFLGKSEKRKRELMAKYEDLKTSGRLDKYMEKRRKKNAAKDHRYLPSSRRAVGGDQ